MTDEQASRDFDAAVQADAADLDGVLERLEGRRGSVHVEKTPHPQIPSNGMGRESGHGVVPDGVVCGYPRTCTSIDAFTAFFKSEAERWVPLAKSVAAQMKSSNGTP